MRWSMIFLAVVALVMYVSCDVAHMQSNDSSNATGTSAAQLRLTDEHKEEIADHDGISKRHWRGGGWGRRGGGWGRHGGWGRRGGWGRHRGWGRRGGWGYGGYGWGDWSYYRPYDYGWGGWY